MSSSPSGSPSSRRVLIAYYSRPGENYYNGERRNLATGNTEVLAGLLADRIEADVFRIEAQEAYPNGCDATVARNVREQDADARPVIAGQLPPLEGYDVVLLGSPIWNVRPPMIMSTFAEAVDWNEKTLHPFVTYAVSRLGRTEEVYREVADGARIGEGLAVLGETVADAGDDAGAWLRRIGLNCSPTGPAVAGVAARRPWQRGVRPARSPTWPLRRGTRTPSPAASPEPASSASVC